MRENYIIVLPVNNTLLWHAGFLGHRTHSYTNTSTMVSSWATQHIATLTLVLLWCLLGPQHKATLYTSTTMVSSWTTQHIATLTLVLLWCLLGPHNT